MEFYFLDTTSDDKDFKKFVTKNWITEAAKTAEATGDLIGNKRADKINSIGKPKEKEKTKEAEEIYIPPEKKARIIDNLQ